MKINSKILYISVWHKYLKICHVYVFAVRKENANMVFNKQQRNISMFLLHVIPTDESTTFPLGRELLYCAVKFWWLFFF